MKRRIQDRILDRLWVEICNFFQDTSPVPATKRGDASGTSISSSMDWPHACDALARKVWTTRGFRRRRSVRQVVETLGIVDGQHFAKQLCGMQLSPAEIGAIRAICDWGDPFKAPSYLLGWIWNCSPTSLRYLAHALWLRQSGWLPQGGALVEIGAGFGGLAAMNAKLSNSKIHIVDLAEVTSCATLMMEECGLSECLIPADKIISGDYTVISNYAFSELTTELQDQYFEKWIRTSRNGVMISNASLFARNISGRDNHEIVSCLRNSGFQVECHHVHPILGPSDIMCGNALITWR